VAEKAWNKGVLVEYGRSGSLALTVDHAIIVFREMTVYNYKKINFTYNIVKA